MGAPTPFAVMDREAGLDKMGRKHLVKNFPGAFTSVKDKLKETLEKSRTTQVLLQRLA